MKKQVLFTAFFVGSLFSGHAQDSCATALPITVGITTVGPITGEYLTAENGGCWTPNGNPVSDATAANWYAFEATTDGMLKINTNLPMNIMPISANTRISVYTGTCGNLACYAAGDDIYPAATGGNFLTNMSFHVTAGEMYYIAFDNRWDATDFDVSLSMVAPATIPYSYSFVESDGWMEGDWTFETQAVVNNWSIGTIAYTNTSSTEASDAWMFSRAITVEAGETIGIHFNSAYLANEGLAAALDLTVGADYENHEVIKSFDIVANQQVMMYEQYDASWTAEESGTYFFGLHNNSPAQGNQDLYLLLDYISFDSFIVAGTGDFSSTNVSIFPNPATNVINVTNNEMLSNIHIADLNGRIVKSVKVNATEAQINISDLSAGVYMMNIATDKGTTTKKIVKN